MAGAVSLRVRGAFRAVTGLEGSVVELMPRSSLTVDDSCTGSSLEVDAGSGIVNIGAFPEVASVAAC